VGSGSKQGATKCGDRGEWSDVRLRRGKALEQVDGRRDRLQEDQQRGASLRHGHFRVRVRYGSNQWDYDSQDQHDFCEQVLSHDGRVTLQYSCPGQSRGGEGYRHAGRSPILQRRSRSRQQYHYFDDTMEVAPRFVGPRGNSKRWDRNSSGNKSIAHDLEAFEQHAHQVPLR
jgi:hypothetical protein